MSKVAHLVKQFCEGALEAEVGTPAAPPAQAKQQVGVASSGVGVPEHAIGVSSIPVAQPKQKQGRATSSVGVQETKIGDATASAGQPKQSIGRTTFAVGAMSSPMSGTPFSATPKKKAKAKRMLGASKDTALPGAAAKKKPESVLFSRTKVAFDPPGKAQGPPSAKAATPKKKADPVGAPHAGNSDDERDVFQGRDVSGLGPRVLAALRKFPGYPGELPPAEAEELWTDQDLHNYMFSSGFLRPKIRSAAPKVHPVIIAEHYKTLGVPPGTKGEEVRKRYRQLALRYHPDKNMKSDDASKFQEISKAYEAICEHLRKDTA